MSPTVCSDVYYSRSEVNARRSANWLDAIRVYDACDNKPESASKDVLYYNSGYQQIHL